MRRFVAARGYRTHPSYGLRFLSTSHEDRVVPAMKGFKSEQEMLHVMHKGKTYHSTSFVLFMMPTSVNKWANFNPDEIPGTLRAIRWSIHSRHGSLRQRPILYRSLEERVRAKEVRQGFNLKTCIRAAFITSKNDFGNRAIARTRTRRRLRAVCRHIIALHSFPGLDFCMIAKPPALFMAYRDLTQELVSALYHLRCYLPRAPSHLLTPQVASLPFIPPLVSTNCRSVAEGLARAIFSLSMRRQLFNEVLFEFEKLYALAFQSADLLQEILLSAKEDPRATIRNILDRVHFTPLSRAFLKQLVRSGHIEHLFTIMIHLRFLAATRPPSPFYVSLPPFQLPKPV